MLTEKRLEKTSELIKERGSLLVQELMDYFQVSDMTIRRDLQKLESSGKFQRFHGGIRYLDETPLNRRETVQLSEKQKIAEYCLNLIQPKDTVILDSGTTSYQIAIAIAKSQISNITVITNSLTVANQLCQHENISLVMCGGELRNSSQSFVGSKARDFFENIYVNKAFIGTGGITEKGFTTTSFAEAEIKQIMAKASAETYIVADHTKFGRRSLNFFAPLSQANQLITDANVSDEWSDILKQSGTELIKV